MKFFLFIATLVLSLFFGRVLWSAGGALWSEIKVLGRAGDLIESGKWQAATDECTKGLKMGPILVGRAALEGCRERAWARGLREAVKAHDFPQAVRLKKLILEGPETGLEEEVRSLGTMLPWRHLEWTGQLLKGEEFDKVLWQCALMRQLYYEEEPQVRSLVRALEERVPLLAHPAMRRVAAQFFVDGKFPGLFRWLEATRKSMVSQPALLQQAERVQEEFIWKVFGVRAPASPSVHGTEEVPPLEEVGPSSGMPDKAVLIIRNVTNGRITVLMRGPENYAVSVAVGEERRVPLRSGEYVQLVHGGNARPWLRVISVDGGLYRQDFAAYQNSEGR